MALIETKIREADNIVNKYMISSMGVGLLPIPLADLIILSSLKLKMLHRLANLYGIAFSKHLSKSLIASLLGGGASLSFSYGLVSLTKSVPLYGQLTGMISISIFGGASTYAIGKVFTQHFESGGTFLTFEPQKVADYYAEQFEKGIEKVKKSSVGIKP
ncbi:MAG: GTPase [Candidatus Parabeggiatoa sp. nov. 1]|nr:MAG: GTPase [Gammaproteobacteria bacterium]